MNCAALNSWYQEGREYLSRRNSDPRCCPSLTKVIGTKQKLYSKVGCQRNLEDLWNLPHCVGAMDGKHVNMKCPNNSASFYYNYILLFSLVLVTIGAIMTVVSNHIQTWEKPWKMVQLISPNVKTLKGVMFPFYFTFWLEMRPLP